jgi:hypothetical protein
MDKAEHKSFRAPDETREFSPGRAEILNVAAGRSAGWSSSPAGGGRMT